MKCRKALPLILFVLVLAVLLPLNANAAEHVTGGFCGNDLIWELDSEGTLTIQGTGDMTPYNNAPWQSEALEIKRVVAEEGVTSIGLYAFKDCTSLTEVQLPSTLTKIDSYAFHGCTNLRAIDIPDGVTEIGMECFYNCTALTSVEIPEGITEIKNGTFSTCSNLSAVTIPSSVQSIASSAFHSCSSLQQVTIPEGVSVIDSYTFYGCSNLIAVQLPESLREIGYNAFYGCKSLQQFQIPAGVISIDSFAFYDCSSLTQIRIPDGITVINRGVFSGCSGLTEVSIPESVTKIGLFAFENCSSLSQIRLPALLEVIDQHAFNSCTSLTAVDIPTSVREIGMCAFNNCQSLQQIVIPEGITDIDIGTFAHCYALTDVTLPDSLRGIWLNAFTFCTSLQRIAIPDNVTIIGDYAFDGCGQLADVTLPKKLETIGTWAFARTAIQELWIPQSVISIGEYGLKDIPDIFYPGTEDQWQALSYTAEGDVHFGCASSQGHIQKTVQPATCEADGYEIKNCSCGYANKRTIPSLGHAVFNCGYMEPTCTKPGAFYYVCENGCGLEYAEEIPASGHNFGQWKNIDSNQQERICAVCGFSEICSRLAAPTAKISNVASTGKIRVSWNKVDGADKYQVYRATSKNGTYTLMKTTTGTSYTNTSAIAGKTYYYMVRAIASDGRKSAHSSIVSRTCDLAQPEVKISNVASSGKIKVSWDKVSGAKEYKVYRATSKNGTYKLVKTTTSTSYTNTSAAAGKTYYYKVKAIHSNSKANSAYSSVVSRTCDLARPDVSIKLSSGDPKLSWDKVSGAVKYKVYRATSKSGTYKLIETTTSTSYTDKSVTAGKTYYYKVIAVHSKSAANSAYSTIDSIKAK